MGNEEREVNDRKIEVLQDTLEKNVCSLTKIRGIPLLSILHHLRLDTDVYHKAHQQLVSVHFISIVYQTIFISLAKQ